MRNQTIVADLPLSHLALSSQILDDRETVNLREEIKAHQNQDPWWLEIETTIPKCTYYFGPFINLEEAVNLQWGYVEDLKKERAVGLKVSIKQCQPTKS